ncbi:hypothetical protein D3C86_2024950 [compost metagenome]
MLIEPNISFTEMSMFALDAWIPRMDARPMDTATEMVSAKHSTIVEIMTRLIGPSPVPCAGDQSDCR